MKIETITEQPTLLIRRLILAPNEAMYWHTDACRRFTVVILGDRLRIEYADTAEHEEFAVSQGMTGWDEPEGRVHRAMNVGSSAYEEVVTFYRESAQIEPQPKHTPGG